MVNFEYDAWGNLTNTPEVMTTGNGEYLRNANLFRYSSYLFDPESGLYYLKARYYTATLSRFLTRDELIGIENKQSALNQYAYCMNNPVNMIDPNGLYSVAIASFVSKYGMGLSGVALATRLTTFVLAVWTVFVLGSSGSCCCGSYCIWCICNCSKSMPRE